MTFPRRTANKYHARITVVDGIRFRSGLEAAYWQYSKLRQLAGEIDGLMYAPRYELVPGFHFEPDFDFTVTATGLHVSVDTKGDATKAGRFPSVCKLWRYTMDHPLHVVERKGRGDHFVTTKTVLPQPLPPDWRGRCVRVGIAAESADSEATHGG